MTVTVNIANLAWSSIADEMYFWACLWVSFLLVYVRNFLNWGDSKCEQPMDWGPGLNWKQQAPEHQHPSFSASGGYSVTLCTVFLLTWFSCHISLYPWTPGQNKCLNWFLWVMRNVTNMVAEDGNVFWRENRGGWQIGDKKEARTKRNRLTG